MDLEQFFFTIKSSGNSIKKYLLVINFFPSLVAISPEELARGMSTIAGSWIGGGANQTAMKEVFNVDGDLFSKMVTVDVLVGNALLAVLLIGAARAVSILLLNNFPTS